MSVELSQEYLMDVFQKIVANHFILFHFLLREGTAVNTAERKDRYDHYKKECPDKQDDIHYRRYGY
jgi:hypothetical protein